jgi:hypothetical protein
MEKTDSKRELKPYVEPTFVEYGALRELTKAVGGRANPDGGSIPTSRTQI